MNDRFPDLPLLWRVNCQLQIVSWCMHAEDPAEKLRDWLDEAGEGDERYIEYAQDSFATISFDSYIRLEARQRFLRDEQRRLMDLGQRE